MKPLTVEELKALKAGDWVWVKCIDDNLFSPQFPMATYCQKVKPDDKGFKARWKWNVCGEDVFFYFKYDNDYDGFNYSFYGTKWIAYKNKEQAECVENTCKNLTDNNPIDEFVCSRCGFEMEDFAEMRIDEDDGEKTYHEFEFRYCPYCGSKVVEE